MVRNIHVGMRFDYEEYSEIKKRADQEHLNVGTYIRHFLFDHHGFYEPQPIEPVRSGVPKRIVSSQIVHAIKRQDRMGEVLKEMENLFSKGLKLKEVTPEMKAQVYKNRKMEEYKPKIIEELHPPK